VSKEIEEEKIEEINEEVTDSVTTESRYKPLKSGSGSHEGFLAALMKNYLDLKRRAKYVFANLYYLYEGNRELDMLWISKYGQYEEIEIKQVRQDFYDGLRDKPAKHQKLADRHESCPNKFSYFTFEGEIPMEDLPEYAGLYELKEDGTIKIVKKAPLLNDNKHDLVELFSKIYYQMDKFRDIWFKEKVSNAVDIIGGKIIKKKPGRPKKESSKRRGTRRNTKKSRYKKRSSTRGANRNNRNNK